MSKGTKPVAVRLPKELLSEVVKTVERRNRNSTEGPWSLSDFIRIALVEKITKMHRSRGQKASSKKVAQREEWIGEEERLVVPQSFEDADCG